MRTTVGDIRTSPIFEGIYDVPEAARYLKASVHGDVAYPVTSTKLIRWIRKGLASPELSGDPGRDLLIAFEDLVSLRIIAAYVLYGSGGQRFVALRSGFVSRREPRGHLPLSTYGPDRGRYSLIGRSGWYQEVEAGSLR